MVIGNNFHNSDHSTDNLESDFIVINLRYDGIRVLTGNVDSKFVSRLQSTNWLAAKDPEYLLKECDKFFEENQIDLSSAKGVLWLLSLSKFCLVPDILYQKGNGEALLSQTARLEVGEHIFSDFWTQRDIVGIYALPQKILDSIRSQNANTRMAHNGFALNSLYNLLSKSGDFFLLQVSEAFAELFIAQKGEVVFYNHFPHDVKEDLLYYILFALEQNRILAPEITLYTSGDIQKGDPFHNLLSKYIGKLEDVKLPENVKAPSEIPTNSLRKFINLIAAL